MSQWIATGLAIKPDITSLVIVFFAYSFLGYVLECVVLSAENRRFVCDRGFARHLPFCIIYGFGALLGFLILSPFLHNPLALFMVGAVLATAFEYLTACLQIRLFGDFWWDYTEKMYNYKGMLCAQSTVGWGFVALLVVGFAHRRLVGVVHSIPREVASPLAMMLVLAYLLDFGHSASLARRNKTELQNENNGLSGDSDFEFE